MGPGSSLGGRAAWGVGRVGSGNAAGMTGAGIEPAACGNDRGGDRTRGLRIKSPLLYQLSYPVAQAEDQPSRKLA